MTDIPDDPRELISKLAEQLGITVDEASHLTRGDLDAVTARMGATVDRKEAEVPDRLQMLAIMDRYPNLLADHRTLGEILPLMAPGDAAQIRELGQHLGCAPIGTAPDTLDQIIDEVRATAAHATIYLRPAVIPVEIDEADASRRLSRDDLDKGLAALRDRAHQPAEFEVHNLMTRLVDIPGQSTPDDEDLTFEVDLVDSDLVAAAGHALASAQLLHRHAEEELLRAIACVWRVESRRNGDHETEDGAGVDPETGE